MLYETDNRILDFECSYNKKSLTGTEKSGTASFFPHLQLMNCFS